MFFQLINETVMPCEVLYIVSPAYTFEMQPPGTVLYDDSLVLDEGWDVLAANDWMPSKPLPILAERNATIARLAKNKISEPSDE